MSDLYNAFLVEKPGGKRREVIEPLELPTLEDVIDPEQVERLSAQPITEAEPVKPVEPVEISAEEFAKAMGFDMPEAPKP